MLALSLECFPGGEAFVQWDVAGKGKEELTQEVEVASTKGTEGLLKEEDAG